jgi:hypothetical protein
MQTLMDGMHPGEPAAHIPSGGQGRRQLFIEHLG